MTYDPTSASIIGTYTVDTKPVPSAALVGKYARITDLFSEKTDLLLCSNSGSSYYWQPVRPVYAKEMAINGAMTLTPLKTPSVIFATAGVNSAFNLTLSNANAWPGASFEIAMDGLLGSLNILGTGLGSGIGVLLGARRRLFWTGSQWKQFT